MNVQFNADRNAVLTVTVRGSKTQVHPGKSTGFKSFVQLTEPEVQTQSVVHFVNLPAEKIAMFAFGEMTEWFMRRHGLNKKSSPEQKLEAHLVDIAHDLTRGRGKYTDISLDYIQDYQSVDITWKEEAVQTRKVQEEAKVEYYSPSSEILSVARANRFPRKIGFE